MPYLGGRVLYGDLGLLSGCKCHLSEFLQSVGLLLEPGHLGGDGGLEVPDVVLVLPVHRRDLHHLVRLMLVHDAQRTDHHLTGPTEKLDLLRLVDLEKERIHSV